LINITFEPNPPNKFNQKEKNKKRQKEKRKKKKKKEKRKKKKEKRKKERERRKKFFLFFWGIKKTKVWSFSLQIIRVSDYIQLNNNNGW
jgi:transposase